MDVHTNLTIMSPPTKLEFGTQCLSTNFRMIFPLAPTLMAWESVIKLLTAVVC
jgi:hypothetical protein